MCWLLGIFERKQKKITSDQRYTAFPISDRHASNPDYVQNEVQLSHKTMMYYTWNCSPKFGMARCYSITSSCFAMFHLARARTRARAQSTNRSPSVHAGPGKNVATRWGIGSHRRHPAHAASVRADKCSLQIAAPPWQTRQLLRITHGDYLHRQSRSRYINAKLQSCMFMLRFTQNPTCSQSPTE